MTTTPIDIAITKAEYNLLRRIRQVKNHRLARFVLVDINEGALRLVGKAEQYEVTTTKDDDKETVEET